MIPMSTDANGELEFDNYATEIVKPKRKKSKRSKSGAKMKPSTSH